MPCSEAASPCFRRPCAGFFGCLKLRIPWNRLQSEPVVLEVDQLLLVIRPKKSEPWNEEEEQRYEYEQKQYQLGVGCVCGAVHKGEDFFSPQGLPP